jgi:hypothetical protein
LIMASVISACCRVRRTMTISPREECNKRPQQS